tara:strand:+ start:120 stop:917 length:798 start_codon:yes stop_codon:yes gene_type:complete
MSLDSAIAMLMGISILISIKTIISPPKDIEHHLDNTKAGFEGEDRCNSNYVSILAYGVLSQLFGVFKFIRQYLIRLVYLGLFLYALILISTDYTDPASKFAIVFGVILVLIPIFSIVWNAIKTKLNPGSSTSDTDISTAKDPTTATNDTLNPLSTATNDTLNPLSTAATNNLTTENTNELTDESTSGLSNLFGKVANTATETADSATSAANTATENATGVLPEINTETALSVAPMGTRTALNIFKSAANTATSAANTATSIVNPE